MNSTNSERRTHQRYLAPGLSILLKSIQSKVDILNEEVLLSTIDFNRFGMAIKSLHNFKIGDELKLVLTDACEQSVEVSCFVSNRAKSETGYRCGLHFFDSLKLINQDLLTK
mgnify:FL=1